MTEQAVQTQGHTTQQSCLGELNLHLYQSPFTHESRILKITKTLIDQGVFKHCKVLAGWDEGLPLEEDIDAQRSVLRIRTKSAGKRGPLWQLLNIIEWSRKAYKAMKKMKPDCVDCHSLPLLPVCTAIKKKTGCKLIYNTHELESESVGCTGVRKKVSKWIERRLIPRVDQVIVVNESIAQWYRGAYGLDNVWTVKNVPYRQETHPEKSRVLRDEFSIPDGHTLYLFQGILGPGRSIPLLLDVFAKADPDKEVVFMGYGGMSELIQEYASKHKNIHYKPAVPPEEVARFTAGADIGLSVIENLCLSYYFGLGNKIFEYVNCGVPCIVSNFPEMGGFVRENGCGWEVEPSAEALAELLRGITPEQIAERSTKASETRQGLGWQYEEEALVSAYRAL